MCCWFFFLGRIKQETKKRCRTRQRCYWKIENGKRKRTCVVRKYACRNYKVCTKYEQVDKQIKVLESQPVKGYFHKLNKDSKECYLYYEFQ